MGDCHHLVQERIGMFKMWDGVLLQDALWRITWRHRYVWPSQNHLQAKVQNAGLCWTIPAFCTFPSWRLIICAGNYQPKLLDLYLCHPAIPPRPAYCTNPNEGTKDNWWLIPTNRIIIIIIIFIYIVFFMDDCLHLYDFYVEFNYRYSIYLYSCINTVKRVLNFAANSLLQLCVCTVIFDAGLGASSDSWFLVYQEISKFTKVTSLWNWIIICLFIGPAIK